jgi:hypothetical protein
VLSSDIATSKTFQPDWLNEKSYTKRIQPNLAKVTISAISKALRVSMPYASGIRAGKRRPQPRHLLALVLLVGASSGD